MVGSKSQSLSSEKSENSVAYHAPKERENDDMQDDDDKQDDGEPDDAVV